MIIFQMGITEPGICGYTSLVTEPEDPKVYVNFYGLYIQHLIYEDHDPAHGHELVEMVDDFVHWLVRVIDHELAHLIGLTRSEDTAETFEVAGVWARA